ncbi:transcription factor HES-1-A-like [Liolophura sinensis]|uniref:transcription factor HES-1-A-like n=1 Tax=Liolophura sinensis TaxID=3198878 RepID=UPI0031583F12
MADTTVCSSDTSSKSSDHKASIRKSNKPLMEKKRRARINTCLGQLKSLVLQALKKDTSQFSKLEKADILEMTVKHLKSIQQQHMSVAMATDPNVLTKYRAGFNECAGEVMRYLGSVNGLTDDTRTRVLNHLAMCMQSVNTAASASLANQAGVVANPNSVGGHMGSCGIPASLFPAFSSPPPQPSSAHVPPVSALAMSQGSVNIPALNGSGYRAGQTGTEVKPQGGCPSSLQLIPGTLPSGQLAFFVASPATIQTPIQAIPVYTAPSSGSSTPVSSPEVSPRSVMAERVSSTSTAPQDLCGSSEKTDTQEQCFGAKNSVHNGRIAETFPTSSRCVSPVPVISPRFAPYSPTRRSPQAQAHSPQSQPVCDNDENSPHADQHEMAIDGEEKVWRPW